MDSVIVGTATVGTPSVRDQWMVRALIALAIIAPFDLAFGSSSTERLLLRPVPVIALAVGIIGFARLLADRCRLRRRPVLLAIVLAWIGFVWVSVLFSDDRLLGSGGALRVTTVGLLALVTASLVGDVAGDGLARRLLVAIVGGTAVAAVVGIAVLLNDGELFGTGALHGSITEIGGRARLTRPWTHANVAAMALGLALPLVVALRRTWTLACGLIIVVAGAATLSRGFALAIGAMTVVTLTTRPTRRQLAGVITAVVVAGALVAVTPGWSLRTDGVAAIDRGADVTPPAQTVRNETVLNNEVVVTVENEGAETWPSEGVDRVELSARWLSPDDPPLVLAEQRWPLPEDVEPGERVAVELLVARAFEPDSSALPDGRYTVLWDLLIDQEAYLLQFAGRSAPSEGIISGSNVTIEPSGTELVTPRRNIGRAEIWRLALDRFAERPLIGVGPNQLGASSIDDIDDDERFPGQHAHNIVLEPLATWGTLGTVPFLVLLSGALMASWRRARRHARPVDRALALSLVAVLAHGMVDWHLGFTSLGIPLAVLLGIAWANLDEF